MRATVLLPAACLALLAPPAAAQQPAPPPGPTATAAPSSAAGQARGPSLRIRVGGVSLDLDCSAGDGTEACARTALGIVDHLNRLAQGAPAGPDESADQDGGGENGGGGDQ